MRILLLSSELTPERAGGIASYTTTLAPALADRGHDVHVLSCAPEHEKRDDYERGVWWHRRRLLGGDRATTRETYRQTATRLATSISCRRELRRLRSTFDVIESPEWLAESLVIGSTTRVPIVVTLHTPLHILFSYDVRRFSRDLRIADLMERSAVRRAALVVSASKLAADRLLTDGWLRRDPRIVPLPVDLQAWSGAPPAGSTAPEILVVGRLEPRKAPEVALEAATLLAEEIDGLRITFVGRSRGYRERRPYGDWVAHQAERLGAPVRFIPQSDHPKMRDLYASARVVSVPSHFESFSMAAVEAMASARPVVYTSGVGAREILTGGLAGTEVPCNDPKAMAEALRPYLADTDHATKSGWEAQALARANCAPDIIAERRERAYEDAISRRGRPSTTRPDEGHRRL